MKVSSPVGDYEYHVRAVSFHRGRIVVAGNLGVWETRMEIEPRDWIALARRAGPPIATAAAVGIALHRLR